MTLLPNLTTSNSLPVILWLVFVMCSLGAHGVPNKDMKQGQWATTLDQYFQSIKCLASIIENALPEYNTLAVCCGVWLVHDWMGSMVLDNCYDHNYHQINNLTEPFIRHMEENCYDYPRDSISCKMMLIFPIFILVLILIFMILLSICAVVTCVRLKRLQRYHEYQTSQGFDSSGTEETTDGVDAALEKKKQMDV